MSPVYKILPFAFLSVALLASSAWPGAMKSQEAVQWLTKAVRAYEREDYGGAKIALQVALETEPNFAEAYLLKGLLEFHDGQNDKADASWDKALKLNPRLPEEMRKRLEKRARAIESKLTDQEFAHFHLQFNGAEQRAQAWTAVKHLDEAYNELGSSFGIFPEKRFPVIIFTSDEFWEAWHAPVWLGGFFDNRDGRIRVRMDTLPGGDEELRQRLRHEFTHAFINRLFPKEIPVWFHEGVAQFYSYASASNGFWKANRLDQLAKQVKSAPWMDLEKVERVLRKKDVHPGIVYLGYLEAEALVLYTAKERGDSWIPSMMQRLNNGLSFEAAFQDVVGISPAQMLENVRRSLS
jgi:tetratricopeptide (TPR) repeat protein